MHRRASRGPHALLTFPPETLKNGGGLHGPPRSQLKGEPCAHDMSPVALGRERTRNRFSGHGLSSTAVSCHAALLQSFEHSRRHRPLGALTKMLVWVPLTFFHGSKFLSVISLILYFFSFSFFLFQSKTGHKKLHCRPGKEVFGQSSKVTQQVKETVHVFNSV